MKDSLLYVGFGKFTGKLEACLYCKKFSNYSPSQRILFCVECPLVQERIRAELKLISDNNK